MPNLVRFSALRPSIIKPGTLLALLSTASQALESIELYMPTVQWIGNDIESLPFANLCPLLPRLHTVHLVLPTLVSPNTTAFITHLLGSTAMRLETLKLSHRSSDSFDTTPFFSSVHLWPVLRTLCLPSETNLSRLPASPSVRKLELNLSSEAPHSHATVPPSAFPVLEELHCKHQDLPAFLPNYRDIVRHPIHTVVLDDAGYGRDAEYGMDASRHAMRHAPDDPARMFAALRRVFASLSHSAVPVTHLSFAMKRFELLDLPSLFLPHGIQALETLTIVIDGEQPDAGHADLLGQAFFAHMPQLHTFLLCEKLDIEDDSFSVVGLEEHSLRKARQKTCLGTFSQHSAVLRRVMLTLDWEWRKSESGEWESVDDV
ncbi:hypothetical protein BD311DRAFT_830919 [Dichomitus squalens]|uniref:F-box domain-containing protein n=1 Tax=Dichomitus squalens TaxID=114155 RepID=A0A4Q9MR04_9APHY|nr:hypothetical protein BD311DRAFT_830919 [Dichomitus squalens]